MFDRGDSSGQPKQAETEIGRNWNKSLKKAEASAETQSSAETFILAKIHSLFRPVNLFMVHNYFGLKLTENSTNTAGKCWKEEEIENQWFIKNPV